MTAIQFNCLSCGGRVVEVTENDNKPPFQPYTYYACGSCGIHHEVDGSRIDRLDVPGKMRGISPEESMQWAARGGCPQICGRKFPWK